MGKAFWSGCSPACYASAILRLHPPAPLAYKQRMARRRFEPHPSLLGRVPTRHGGWCAPEIIALRKQRLAELGLKDPEEEETMSEDKAHTGTLSVDDWFAGDSERVFDGPFHRKFPSGMDIEIDEDGVVVIQMPLNGNKLELGCPRSLITLCAEHVPHAKEWLEKAFSYLQNRQNRLDADHS